MKWQRRSVVRTPVFTQITTMMMMMVMMVMMMNVHAFKTTTTTSTASSISTSSSRRIIRTTSQQHRYLHPLPPSPAYHGNTRTILNVATGGNLNPMSTTSNNNKVLWVEWNRDRLQRSMVASLGCLFTWLLANTKLLLPLSSSLPLTIVQASCTTGLLSCLLFTTPYSFPFPAYSVATFCGALAGMSGNVLQYTSNLSSVSFLLPIALMSLSVGYAFGLWDDRKWGVGKGGRLGTIAFGGNMLFTLSTFLYQTFLLRANSNNIPVKLFTLIPSTTQQMFASMPILTSLALSTVLLRSSREPPSSSVATAKDTQQQQLIYKALLYGTLAVPMFMNGGSQGLVRKVTEYLGTVVSIFVGSQLVHKNIGKYGPILPTSVVGMLGSLLFAGSGHFGITSPKIFLGALMGLTTIPTFGAGNLAQSSY